jgi:hypothetical protein
MSIPVAHEKVMEITAEIAQCKEFIKKLEENVKELEVLRANLVARIEELS